MARNHGDRGPGPGVVRSITLVHTLAQLDPEYDDYMVGPICRFCLAPLVEDNPQHRDACVWVEARKLGVDHNTVSRWATRWHGPTGQGRHRQFDHTDVLVARAWHALTGTQRGGMNNVTQWCSIAETAIRAQPLSWLLIADGYAETFHEAEHAAEAWWDSGLTSATLINLEH